MKNAFIRPRFFSFLLTVLTVFGTVPALAEEKSPEDWQYFFELYLWTPRLEIAPGSGDKVIFKFNDIFKNLDMAFMGDVGARKGDMSMGLDLIYLNLGKNVTRDGDLVGLPGELKANADLRGVIGTFNAGYTVSRTQRNRLDIIGGTRYVYLNAGLEARDEAVFVEKEVHYKAVGWDFLLGFEGRTLINDHWHFDYYADIGSGFSKLTWQAKAGFGYEFEKWTGTFGFRYLHYDLHSYRRLKSAELYGPYFGAKWSW